MNVIQQSYKYKNLLLLSGFILLVVGIAFVKRKDIKKYMDTVHNQFYINNLNESAKPYFEDLFEGIRKLGYEPYITSAYRDYDKTIALKAQDSRNASISYHNFGVALDLNIKKDGVIILGKGNTVAEWEKTGIPKLAKKLDLIWGGTDIEGYIDTVHFDLRKVFPMDKMLKDSKVKYGDNLRLIMDNGNKLKLVA